MNIVFDSVSEGDKKRIEKLIRHGDNVWIIEPFYAYHHRNMKDNYSFFPLPLPESIKKLINKDKISVISADELNAPNINNLAADSAVNSIETVFQFYKSKHDTLFNYVARILKSKEAESIFKLKLSERLAEFFSYNIMLKRVEDILPWEEIKLISNTNPADYFSMYQTIRNSGFECCHHTKIQFESIGTKKYIVLNAFKKLKITLLLVLQTIGSFLFLLRKFKKPSSSAFKYGLTVVSPDRQLKTDTFRGPDFLIDGQKISKADVVFVPITKTKSNQKEKLNSIGCAVDYSFSFKLFFSNFKEWLNLLIIALKSGLNSDHEELTGAAVALSNYFRWNKQNRSIDIQHLITHADFGRDAIARNISLKQSGVQIWYFTDSINCGVNFQTDNQQHRHPFWAYMNYDHLVTWNSLLGNYLKGHPASFGKVHVTGCLWSSFVQNIDKARKNNADLYTNEMEAKLILGVYDSTYTNKSFTSYSEGIAFAEHLFQLIEQVENIYILFKEKKSRTVHPRLDSVLGPELVTLYEKFDKHPRIKMVGNQFEASDVMAISDAVISFPFTSTSYEFLSVQRPAIWHDPFGLYKETPFAKVGSLTTHSYNQLADWVKNVMENKWDNTATLAEYHSKKLFPFTDGNAIERFRDLLISKEQEGAVG